MRLVVVVFSLFVDLGSRPRRELSNFLRNRVGAIASLDPYDPYRGFAPMTPFIGITKLL